MNINVYTSEEASKKRAHFTVLTSLYVMNFNISIAYLMQA